MINKQFYETPGAELLEVKFEENILSDPGTMDGSSIENGTVNNQDNQNSIWHWQE